MKTTSLKMFIGHPLVAGLVLLVAPVGFYHWTRTATARQDARPVESSLPVNPANSSAASRNAALRTRMVDAPGVHPREYHASEVAGVSDADPVIGVIVGGKARAYVANAFCSPETCVVNDVLAGLPISIIYAHGSGCIRAVVGGESTVDKSSQPLSLVIHSIRNQELYLAYASRTFHCSEDISGLTDYPHAFCSWKVWKQAYPETDVYTGDLPQAAE